MRLQPPIPGGCVAQKRSLAELCCPGEGRPVAFGGRFLWGQVVRAVTLEGNVLGVGGSSAHVRGQRPGRGLPGSRSRPHGGGWRPGIRWHGHYDWFSEDRRETYPRARLAGSGLGAPANVEGLRLVRLGRRGVDTVLSKSSLEETNRELGDLSPFLAGGTWTSPARPARGAVNGHRAGRRAGRCWRRGWGWISCSRSREEPG